MGMTADPADFITWTPEWTLGDRLRKIRRRFGISQTEFAEMIGQNPKSYSSWESDQAKPRQLVEVALKISVATGVPTPWVLGISETTTGRLPAIERIARRHPVITPEYGPRSAGVIIKFPQVTPHTPEQAATTVPVTARDQSCEHSEIAA